MLLRSPVLMLMGNPGIVRMMGIGMLMRMIVFGIVVTVFVRMNDDLPRAAALAAILDADFPCAFTFRTSFCHCGLHE